VLLNIIKKSFFNQKKAMALMIASVAVGTAVAASLITLSLEISGKVSRELRAFGANIIVQPKIEGLADISGQKRYLRQEDIVKVKTIFWRHNILGIAPFLDSETDMEFQGNTERVKTIGVWYEKKLPLPGKNESFSAGIKTVSPWWHIEGSWPKAGDEIIVGTSLAVKLGMKKDDILSLDGEEFRVSGILETGAREDDLVFLNMEDLQSLKGMEGKVSRVFVGALTKPMDEFASRDPEDMSQTEYEKWYCSGYVTSIAKQLEEVFIGSHVRPIWNVAEAEGRVLQRLELLIYFLSFIAIAASALGVSTTMIMSLLRRTDEIGLMKSLGADSLSIVTLFLLEGIMIGLIGGLLGYILSLLASQYIGLEVFQVGLEQRAVLLPIAILSAIVIAIAGTVLPVRKALGIKPGLVMRGAE
jgi:putative ABC transport system permease protein